MTKSREQHGGKRAGAGRKPVPPVSVEGAPDMLALLQDIALGKVDASPNQVKAAIAAIRYTHEPVSPAKKKQPAEDSDDPFGLSLRWPFGEAEAE
ncbi:MAG: hypothetical protein KUL77_07840 [Thermomonas sp.]|uniref:hypothetical protein n=1 Tax=Thermomonas sp. TaxID=1971895 RepID=UPI001ECCF5A8|nr:hypothetical protein [Thermomonas sp.]MBV2209458.1 hypothetical protein [Thermomonas sp.]